MKIRGANLGNWLVLEKWMGASPLTSAASEDDRGLIELVNPEIIAAEGEQGGPEGCLSKPGRQGYVVRPNKVTVRAQDRHGKFFEITGEGLLARAFCHEIDHLDGKLYIDVEDHEIKEDEEEPRE